MFLSLLRGGSRLAPTRGEDLVFVEWVGISPAHQHPPVGSRKIRGIGKMLIAVACLVSEENGCGGRVGLHSKPKVESFYEEVCGFTFVEMDEFPDGRWR
jgi:hypothetical protein